MRVDDIANSIKRKISEAASLIPGTAKLRLLHIDTFEKKCILNLGSQDM